MQASTITVGNVIAIVLLGLVTLVFPSPSLANEVIDVRLWRAPDHTRVVFDLSDAIKHSIIQLDNPTRVVVDINDVRLRGALSDLPLENTPIDRVRSGIRKGNDLRIVFDLRAKVTPKSFALDPNERTGHRLVLDLFDDAPTKTEQPEIQAGLTPATKSVEELDDRRDIIVAIDAGHGGEDPGASGPKKLREKDVVLNIVNYVIFNIFL